MAIKRKISAGEIRAVVKEYIFGMLDLFQTLQGTTSDCRIDCPSCKRDRAIAYDESAGWRCVYRDCHYTFPKRLNPPSPLDLRIYYERKKMEKKIDFFLK